MLQPDEAYLELLGRLLGDVDYYEVAPETLAWVGEDGGWRENAYFRRFEALARDTGRPFVAHGVGLSLGTAAPEDRARRRAALAWATRCHRAFDFGWYTDHLGATSLAGQAVTLPIALPMTAYAAAATRRTLAAMQRVVPHVGVENSVAYFLLGDPLAEPAFLGRILRAPQTHLLLDLHNVHTMAENFGFDPQDYLARLDLSRVIEIHLSGGSYSDPAWLASGRTLRLDGHDDAIPEQVFRLFEATWRRCPNLRGVTVERMEGTVTAGDVAGLQEEVRRTRVTLRGRAT